MSQLRDDASTNIVGFACTLTYLCSHPPTASSLQAHSPLNPRSSSFQVIALHARSVLPPMHHRSPSPGTLLLSPRIPSLFPRRANHTMKNVTEGKGIVTAAVHESTSACRRVNSSTPPPYSWEFRTNSFQMQHKLPSRSKESLVVEGSLYHTT